MIRRLARLALAPAMSVLALQAPPATPARAGDALPSWAEEARGAPTPSSFGSADAVVLLHESSIIVEPGDRYRETRRRAVRILNSAGAREAVGYAHYRTDGDKVLRLDAWIVAADGRTRKLGGKEVIDRAAVDDDLYNEGRVRLYDATDVARPGAVFAFESVVEHRSPFAQFQWWFQEDIPTCLSRLRLKPPNGWAVAATAAGLDSIVPRAERGVWTWELRDVPAIEDEPLRPPSQVLAARIAVNLLAPEGASTERRHVIRRWEDAAAWQAERVAALGLPNERVRRKATALVAGATHRGDSLRAIAGFVQSVNYVSIQMGLGRGGGYVPHPPEDVLSRSYGDCKDKSNLMRALLESIGIESYLVAIRSSGGEFTLRDHPGLDQFDHCILAVRCSDPSDATVESKRHGRLVLFDPTDPNTPWGSLPVGEQGSWALLVAPEGGELLHAPSSAPGASRRSRTIDATLTAAGTVDATLRVEARGGAGSSWRGAVRSRGAVAIEREREWWMGRSASAAVVDSFGVHESDDGRFLLSAHYRMPGVGEPMAGQLLVVNTARFGILSIPALPDTPRVHPIEIPTDLYEERISLRLPPGYAVEETPGPVSYEAPYGNIQFEIREEPGVVIIERVLERRRTVLPAIEYEGVRRFYGEARRAFSARLVLSRR